MFTEEQIPELLEQLTLEEKCSLSGTPSQSSDSGFPP